MKQLAKITSAKLSIQERGILTFWIFVEYESGGGQGLGGLALDGYDKELQRRVGSSEGCELIRQLLLVLEVDDFSEMKGKHVWVHGEGEGFSFEPYGIQLLNVDSDGIKHPLLFKSVFETKET